MPEMLAMPFVALSVGAFLETSELATCEQAQTFSPRIFEWLWNAAGLKWLENTPLWNNAEQEFLEKGLHGKELILGMKSFRRTVFPSKWLRPWIVETSFSSIKATPNLKDLPEGQREDTLGAQPRKPQRSTVFLAVGTNRGQSVVIGMKFAAAGPVNDNLCLGIEAVGCICCGHRISISFAPYSGSCFIEHENGMVARTQALPRVDEALEGYVWIHVTEKGGIRFLRQIKDNELEDTGFLPPEILPNWVRYFFGAIHSWFNGLEVAVDVSVEFSGSAFPTTMPISNEHGVEMKSLWTVLSEDDWRQDLETM